MARSQRCATTGSACVVGRAGEIPEIGAAAGIPDVQCRQEQCILHMLEHRWACELAAVGACIGLVVDVVVDSDTCSHRVSPWNWMTH